MDVAPAPPRSRPSRSTRVAPGTVVVEPGEPATIPDPGDASVTLAWRRTVPSTAGEQMDQHESYYRRSSCCSGGTCLEVALRPDGSVAVRNSADADNVLLLDGKAWRAFVQAVKDGQLGSRSH